MNEKDAAQAKEWTCTAEQLVDDWINSDGNAGALKGMIYAALAAAAEDGAQAGRAQALEQAAQLCDISAAKYCAAQIRALIKKER